MAVGDGWPLVLAGPWLRRVDTTHVSVFLAFRTAQAVTVTVSLQGVAVAVSPATQTVAVGAKLHVVVVTAEPVGVALSAGHVYEYDVSFSDNDGHSGDLSSENLRTASSGVVYVDGGLPGFALPPAAITDVNLVHGSCRKVHGGSIDMLASLDKLIEDNRTKAVSRPHQLFLTGDQIYADDVADALLALLTPAGEALLGWTEELPGLTAPHNHPADLAPGKRADVMTAVGGAGAGITTEPRSARAVTDQAGECDVPVRVLARDIAGDAAEVRGTLPRPVRRVRSGPGQAEAVAGRGRPGLQPAVRAVHRGEGRVYEAQTASVASFQAQLVKVRRALANIPTYTICDDHEVTDDWYMNKDWCKRVLGQPLGTGSCATRCWPTRCSRRGATRRAVHRRAARRDAARTRRDRGGAGGNSRAPRTSRSNCCSASLRCRGACVDVPPTGNRTSGTCVALPRRRRWRAVRGARVRHEDVAVVRERPRRPARADRRDGLHAADDGLRPRRPRHRSR